MGLEVDWRPERFHLECPCKTCHDVKEKFCSLSAHTAVMGPILCLDSLSVIYCEWQLNKIQLIGHNFHVSL